MTSLFRGPVPGDRRNARNIFNAPTMFRPGLTSTVPFEAKQTQQNGILSVLDSIPPTALGRASVPSTVTTKASFDKLTFAQTKTIAVVHDSYTHLLATKKYESIRSNYSQYLTILKTLKTINIIDPVMKLLIRIAEDAIHGAVDSVSLNSTYIASQIKILELNKYIDEILSNKNVKSTMSTGITADMKTEKMFKLSPIFSYYIYIYGMPEFGKGFDSNKVSLIQELAVKTKNTLLAKTRDFP
jgi:hypothetical protein